jgi:hypothetical protein
MKDNGKSTLDPILLNDDELSIATGGRDSGQYHVQCLFSGCSWNIGGLSASEVKQKKKDHTEYTQGLHVDFSVTVSSS